MHTQHCSYRCAGAKAPGHQYPECWMNFYYIGPFSYWYIIFIGNNIRNKISFWPKYPVVQDLNDVMTVDEISHFECESSGRLYWIYRYWMGVKKSKKQRIYNLRCDYTKSWISWTETLKTFIHQLISFRIQFGFDRKSIIHFAKACCKFNGLIVFRLTS